jgi:geranylgeranylglycerol-phosphate geranylgeranyltransferase
MALETENVVAFASKTIPLPAASFLIIIGMYVLNDLMDADLDRLNEKKRPIPVGQVSETQAWIFIILTNGIGLSMALLTFNTDSIIIALVIALIGLMYSIPKLALKDRFVIKTLSIAIAMILCTMLGSTVNNWNTNYVSDDNNHFDRLSISIYAASMLGTMIFVTSPLNDLGDVIGDKAAGRRTIPIVIGRENTVKLSIFIATSMSIVSWIVYVSSDIGIVIPISVSLVIGLTIANITKILKLLDDYKFARDFVKKRSMPLHIMLQLALIIGALLFWI